MGEFDDVLAMEPGDEWDDHVVGRDADHAVELRDLVAMLQLPNAGVDLRGDVPAAVAELFTDLGDDSLVLLGDGVPVTLTVHGEGDDWRIEDLDRGEVAVGSTPESLADELIRLLDELAVATDPMRLHLDAACVVRGGDGVLITEFTDVGAGVRPHDRAPVSRDERGDRSWLVADLLESGSDYVCADLLTVMPGSRTVFAHPMPLAVGDQPPARVSDVAPVAPHARVGHVFLLDHVPGSAVTVEPVEPPEATVQLLHRCVDLVRMGPGALDALAPVVSGANSWRVTYSEATELAAALASLDAPPTDPCLTVVHRFDGRVPVAPEPAAPSGTEDELDAVPEAVARGRASLRVARFADRGALYDGASGAALVLDSDELDAIEELLVKLPKAARAERAGGTDRLQRVRDAGIALPVAVSSRPSPGVESFGLPNCPGGGTARRLWATSSDGRIAKASGTPSDEVVPGAIAEALLAGIVSTSDSEREAILERHETARADVEAIEGVLFEVLEVADREGIVPLVLGAVVLAHDGPLPPRFTDSEQIELLVDAADRERLVEALGVAGFERATPPDDDAPSPYDELARPGPASVRIRLHWKLTFGPFGELVNHEEFHRRSVPVRLAGRWCRALHPEDRFVLTCVQLDLVGNGATVQDLRDVVLCAPRVESLMAESFEASERWGATTSVIAAVRRVDGVMPGLSPWLIERAGRYQGRARRKAIQSDSPGSRKRGLLRRRNRG